MELFPKTADATMELSIDLGTTFKKSLKYEDNKTNTSLQFVLTLPTFQLHI